MELWTKSTSSKLKRGSDACLECADDVCALLPPSGSSFPCYQGSDHDANVCYNTDPLLPDGSTYVCGTCAAAGYPAYLQNDPIYKTMELWSASGAVSAGVFHPSQADVNGKRLSLNTTTGGPYTYSQSNHHFYGTAYDGSYIDTTSACSGANDSCRDNPDCQCNVRTIFSKYELISDYIIISLSEKRRTTAPRHLHPRGHVHLQGLPVLLS